MDHNLYYPPFKTWYNSNQQKFWLRNLTPEQIAYAAWIEGTKLGLSLQVIDTAQDEDAN